MYIENILKSGYIRNTILNYFFKTSTMIINYITIPLTLIYLNTERYGIWQTMLTIISWATLSNFGIGNSLRNKVTEALTEEKYDKLKCYITNAYIYLTIISIIVLNIAITLILSINTNVLFKNNTLSRNEIIISFAIIIFSFCLNFILGISSTISYAIHKSSDVSAFQIISGLVNLFGLIILNKFTESSIINISLLYLISNSISNLFLTFHVFRDKKLQPNMKFKNKAYGKELVTLGMEFFILQLSSVILLSTDNFIISVFIGTENVTSYSVVIKVFQVVSTLFSILLIQLWSWVARAMSMNDCKSIRKMTKTLLLLLIGVAGVLLIMVSKFDLITELWLGTQLKYDNKLIYLAAFYTLLICFNGIFTNIQNGMSKIRIQTISSIICCIINIPMAIIFIIYFNLGETGVIISNIISLSIMSIVCCIDVVIKVGKCDLEV